MHNQNQSGVAGRNFITNILQTVVLSFLIIEREYEKKMALLCTEGVICNATERTVGFIGHLIQLSRQYGIYRVVNT